jgi:hypothetical protein
MPSFVPGENGGRIVDLRVAEEAPLPKRTGRVQLSSGPSKQSSKTRRKSTGFGAQKSDSLEIKE